MYPADWTGVDPVQPALPLAHFLIGYAAVLVTPGPNMLAIGGLAALGGLRRAMPLCLGLALGAGALSATVLLLALGAVAGAEGWQEAGRLLGGALLLLVALGVARMRPPGEPAGAGESANARTAAGAAAFGAGFLTAATNPLTGNFFAAQFLGPVGTRCDMMTVLVLPLAVALIALLFFLVFLGVAALLARPAARRAALAWHGPVRFGAAALLVAMAAGMLGTGLGWAGGRASPRAGDRQGLACRAMRYVSTRGEAPPRDFEGVLLAGLAEDGGLFLPESWPSLSASEWRALRGLPYPELAARIVHRFTENTVSLEVLRGMAEAAYAGFGHPAVAPLVQLDHRGFAFELFHGPTLAFKDMAMQLLGRLFDHVLARRGERITIVGATSGDTGSAAIEACRDRAAVDIVILHPRGRTSEVQRRQMTTVLSPNVRNLAVEGSFDDCQDLVKAMFNDAPFRREMRLAAVNSINWARVAAQIPYYAFAALALGAPDRPVAFSVPTGNFGNVLAAWAVRRMGLPVERLIVGANRNDILARWIAGNDMSVRPVEPSLSPSMDIQVSSNFERLLFELLGRDGAATAGAMRRFRAEGRMPVPDAAWREATALFHGFTLDDEGTLAEIRHLWERAGYLADPHTAVGTAAARTLAPEDPGIPVIVAATAHPAKFPDAVERATGRRPPLPPRLADLYEREERFEVLPPDLDSIEGFVRSHARRNLAA